MSKNIDEIREAKVKKLKQDSDNVRWESSLSLKDRLKENFVDITFKYDQEFSEKYEDLDDTLEEYNEELEGLSEGDANTICNIIVDEKLREEVRNQIEYGEGSDE